MSKATNTAAQIPLQGYGVWRIAPEDTQRCVEAALAAGYRHIDTAAYYHNEREVGLAIRASGLAREDVFITTKLWNADHRRERALRAIDVSLTQLGLDYVDLYLVHWPVASTGLATEAWQALTEIQGAGKARLIGVSNFRPVDLDAAIAATGRTPAVNQVELHPTFQQHHLREYHRTHGIATAAWAPLGVGADLTHPTVEHLAAAHGVSPAQVILRWLEQLNIIAVAKTTSPQRMAQNLDIHGFTLSPAELEAMASCHTGVRLGPDPTPPAGRMRN